MNWVHELSSSKFMNWVHELSSSKFMNWVHELSSSKFINWRCYTVALSQSQCLCHCHPGSVAMFLSPRHCHPYSVTVMCLSFFHCHGGVFVTPSLSFCLHRDVYIANVTVILFLSWCSNIASQSPCHCHSVSVTIPPSSGHWYRVSDTLSLPPCLRHGRGGGCHVYHSHRVFTSRSLSPCLCHGLS